MTCPARWRLLILQPVAHNVRITPHPDNVLQRFQGIALHKHFQVQFDIVSEIGASLVGPQRIEIGNGNVDDLRTGPGQIGDGLIELLHFRVNIRVA